MTTKLTNLRIYVVRVTPASTPLTVPLPFPVTQLRRESAWPRTDNDAIKLAAAIGNNHDFLVAFKYDPWIELLALHEPNQERWRSAGTSPWWTLRTCRADPTGGMGHRARAAHWEPSPDGCPERNQHMQNDLPAEPTPMQRMLGGETVEIPCGSRLTALMAGSPNNPHGVHLRVTDLANFAFLNDPTILNPTDDQGRMLPPRADGKDLEVFIGSEALRFLAEVLTTLDQEIHRRRNR